MSEVPLYAWRPEPWWCLQVSCQTMLDEGSALASNVNSAIMALVSAAVPLRCIAYELLVLIASGRLSTIGYWLYLKHRFNDCLYQVRTLLDLPSGTQSSDRCFRRRLSSGIERQLRDHGSCQRRCAPQVLFFFITLEPRVG